MVERMVSSDWREKLREIVKNESIMIAKDVIVDLYTAFEKFLKFAGPVLYNAAKKAGRHMAKVLMERGVVDDQNAVEALLESIVDAGYASEARVLGEKDAKKEKIIEVAMKGTLLGSKLQRKKPVDLPIAGFMAGWLETVYGKHVDVKEVACMATGSNECIFQIHIKK